MKHTHDSYNTSLAHTCQEAAQPFERPRRNGSIGVIGLSRLLFNVFLTFGTACIFFQSIPGDLHAINAFEMKQMPTRQDTKVLTLLERFLTYDTLVKRITNVLFRVM